MADTTENTKLTLSLSLSHLLFINRQKKLRAQGLKTLQKVLALSETDRQIGR
jgi:hypothetical protein